ncbi:hypothetical protein ACQ4PT_023119 [Festuca glaucescens]
MEVERVIPRGSRIEAYESFPVSMKTYCSAVGTASGEEESRHLLECEPAPGRPAPADEEANARRAARRACNWLRLLFFPRSVPEPTLSAEELDAELAALHDQKVLRCSVSRSELRAINHKIVLQCLEWYNSRHPGNEYEPAPGVVTRRSEFNNSLLWTHGNFVARPKRSGCFSFLPSPRTLFFFELLDRYDVDELITCIPLDEPVTEGYIFHGFRLGQGTRRDGRCDCVCKTCYRQFHVPHMDLKRTCACGDSKVEGVCKMCYLSCDVLHPSGGGFVFGHNKESFAYY